MVAPANAWSMVCFSCAPHLLCSKCSFEALYFFSNALLPANLPSVAAENGLPTLLSVLSVATLAFPLSDFRRNVLLRYLSGYPLFWDYAQRNLRDALSPYVLPWIRYAHAVHRIWCICSRGS